MLQVSAVTLDLQYSYEHMREFGRCASNPFHFFDNYVYVDYSRSITGDVGRIGKIKLCEVQRKAVKMLHEPNILLENDRQTGTTLILALDALHRLIFKDAKIAFLSHQARSAAHAFEKISNTFINLPRWIKPATCKHSTSQIILDNDSSVTATVTNSSELRGVKWDVIYVDNAPWCNQEALRDLLQIFPQTEFKLASTFEPSMEIPDEWYRTLETVQKGHRKFAWTSIRQHQIKSEEWANRNQK